MRDNSFGTAKSNHGEGDPLTARRLELLILDVQDIMAAEGLTLAAACRVLASRVQPARLERYAMVLEAQASPRWAEDVAKGRG